MEHLEGGDISPHNMKSKFTVTEVFPFRNAPQRQFFLNPALKMPPSAFASTEGSGWFSF